MYIIKNVVIVLYGMWRRQAGRHGFWHLRSLHFYHVALDLEYRGIVGSGLAERNMTKVHVEPDLHVP
jgi:hypothetical protein